VNVALAPLPLAVDVPEAVKRKGHFPGPDEKIAVVPKPRCSLRQVSRGEDASLAAFLSMRA